MCSPTSASSSSLEHSLAGYPIPHAKHMKHFLLSLACYAAVLRARTSIAPRVHVLKLFLGCSQDSIGGQPTAADVVPKSTSLVKTSRYSSGISSILVRHLRNWSCNCVHRADHIVFSKLRSERSKRCCNHFGWIHCRKVCLCFWFTFVSVPVPSEQITTFAVKGLPDVLAARQEPCLLSRILGSNARRISNLHIAP